MPRYKFAWENLSPAVLKQLARDLGLSGDSPAEALHAEYGARPDAEFVADAWEPLRERWLADDQKGLDAAVKALWRPGTRDGYRPPQTAEEQLDSLRERNNVPRLREVVLAQLIAAGESPNAPVGPVATPPSSTGPSSPAPRLSAARQPPPSLPTTGSVPGHVSQIKEVQRAELHKTIWRIANDLRGSVDGWDFKSYVLGMLFYRFISENLTAYLNRMERDAGDSDFDYAKLSDEDAEFGRRETVAEKGFYILPSELFVNIRTRAGSDENLNESLERVFKNIEGSAAGADSEDDLKGLFDDLDINSAKLGPTVAKRNEKLVKLLEAIGDLNLGSEFTEHTIDAFGDAYEYLMTMYASGAGKSGGEFFTPQEVSELLARITVIGKTAVNKVYDPACGSGSLLLKFAKVLGKDNVRLGFFGQESNLTTYNLARINMFLHDINYEKFDIAHGDTLLEPAHWDDEPFEAIVSNPPYSINWEGDANPLLINDPRYAPAGVLAPKSKADLAFTMHILQLARGERHCGDRRVPGSALPRRRRTEDPQVLDRQQLRRLRHPATTGSVLRHHHHDMHHCAQEV